MAGDAYGEYSSKIDELTNRKLDDPSTRFVFPRFSGAGSLISRMEFVRLDALSRFWESPQQPTLEYSTLRLIQGMHGEALVGCFLLQSIGSRVNCFYGIDPPSHSSADGFTIEAIVRSALPGVRLARHPDQPAIAGRLATILTGAPLPSREGLAGERIDKLCRGLYGYNWNFCVVFHPVQAGDVTSDLEKVNRTLHMELKQSQRDETILGLRGPNKAHIDLLEGQRKRLEAGLAQGMWSVRAYFLADEERVLNAGKVILQSAFSEEDTSPQHVRMSLCDAGLAEDPVDIEPLTAPELSVLVTAPREEYPGYEVEGYLRFGVGVAETSGPGSIRVGGIIDQHRNTGIVLSLPVANLTKHGLISGVTGSGKTNTCFELLAQVAQLGIPFLVIESAKSEYRRLLKDQRFPGNLVVYTVGDETIFPFRLNPFEVPANILVQTHIDYLKSLFSAAFVLYPPMPYVLEQSIQELYADKGWNLSSRNNERAGEGDNSPRRFPTLGELVKKVRIVVERMGYDERLKMDVTAGLVARLDQLRGGGNKGPMLDTRQSVEVKDLFERPCVIELKQMVSDDEKAFFIGLLLLRLYEYHEGRVKGTPAKAGKAHNPLRHLTLIEEAHRLLRNVSTERGSEVAANPKGQAIEVFANILSEVRAYGEGILMAEQVPTKLTPDAIKNTNLKIVHRLLARDDRDAIGATVNLTQPQSDMLTRLEAGYAVAYAEGMSKPVLLKVDLSSSKESEEAIGDDDVRGEVQRRYPRQLTPEFRLDVDAMSAELRSAYGAVLGQVRFGQDAQRLAESAQHFAQVCRVSFTPGQRASPTQAFAALLDDEIERRGHAGWWSFADMDRLFEVGQRMFLFPDLSARHQPSSSNESTALRIGFGEINRFRQMLWSLNAIPRQTLPYAGCIFCDSPCQYRFEVHLPQLSEQGHEIRNALNDDSRDGVSRAALAAAQSRFPGLNILQVQRRAGFCFGIQHFGGMRLPSFTQVDYAMTLGRDLGLLSEQEEEDWVAGQR